jgi:hypothetical protein
MLLRDFECLKCRTTREELVSDDDVVVCRKCENPMVRVFLQAPREFKVIVPIYPGSKAQKAGYVHTHGARPAEKLQVQGWTPDAK